MDKVRQWSLLTAVGVVAVLVAGWFLLVSPEHSKAASLRNQAVTQEGNNHTLSTSVDVLRQEQKSLPAQQAKLAQIARQIPSNPALPSLIRSLTVAANGSGVDLVSIAPSAPALVTAQPGAAAVPVRSTAPIAAGGALAQIPLAIQVKGTYANLELFVQNLEGMSRSLLTSGITIAPVSGSSGPALNATLTSRVFMDAAAASTAVTPIKPIKPVAPSTASK